MKRIFNLKNMLFGLLVMVMLMGAMVQGKQANAATATGKVPITSYVTGYNSVRTYNGINGSGTGWIYSGDKCTILNVYSSGWCRVRYPVGKGTRTAYTYSKYFFSDINFSTATTTPGKNMAVYTKPNLKTKLGTVYSGDNILIIGSLNGNQQILYPISGGYKMGFVSGEISSAVYAPIVYNGRAEDIEKLLFDATFYANEYSDLKAAFGYDQTKLYNHWLKHGIKEGRGASPILNLKYYLANNEDLRNAFGAAGYEAAYQHFIKYGYAEYRNSSKYYNGDYYRRNNTDLKTFNSLFLVNHYMEYGVKEGRNANTVKYVPGVSNDSTGNVENNNYATSTVKITSNGQVVDTFNGVSAKYIPGTNNSNSGTYCCARYVSNYYKSVYGVTVSNLYTGRTPNASSGYFYTVSDPQVGDIGYQTNSKGSGHWFIIKSVNSDGTYCIIEQNWKWKSGGSTYCNVNRKVSKSSTKGFKVFRWSKK